ncbi:RbsD/FucU domain-containing protein [soil metagenome]
MLKTDLIHPQLLAALGRAGHGSKILLSDGNFPHGTGANPAAERVYLNLAPGMLRVDQVLAPLLASVPVEAAEVMASPDGEVEAVAGYREMLAGVPFAVLERASFYEAARGGDVAIVIATGDQRVFANLLLTIGVVAG